MLGQQVLNVYQYAVDVPLGEDDPVSLGNAWWNNIKSVYRAIPAAAMGDVFQSVIVRELNNPAGAYGQYAIPPAEKPGTRGAPAQQEQMPPFCAAAIRLVVGSRATRPGQKRIAYLTESDNMNGVLQSAFVALLQPLGVIISNDMTMGAPTLATVLHPIVCRKDASGVVTAHQKVVGYLISPYVSSQNTRKIGRGA